MTLYHELKRRNVFRVAAAYLAGAWLFVEVAGTLFPIYGLSDAAVRVVVTLMAIGFPLALILSWVYELTPEGLKLEKDIDRAAPTPRAGTRKLDRTIIVLLTLALGFLAFDKFVLQPARDVEIAVTAEKSGAERALKEAREAVFSANSIAVLPFENMSSDIEQEYFSDGLSDMLIHVLAQVSGLKVIAKTSSFYFKGKDINVGEIARQLNVGTILEGSVQKSGDHIRVIAQLINANDGTHYWSKNFDRDLQDIFAVQDEIARQIVESLKITLLDAEEQRFAQRYQPTLPAHDQLILGRHEMARRTADSLTAAEQHFKRAIELDPEYAVAYIGLADTYELQVGNASLVWEESLQRRQLLIEKALELDPLSGEAYTARASLLGSQYLASGGKGYSTEEQEIIRAIELNPNYAVAYQRYSGVLSGQGHFDEALAQMRLAAELDPMSPIIQTAVAGLTWKVGRAEEAMALVRRNIERTPEFPHNYSTMAEFQIELGNLGDAQRWRKAALGRNPDGPYLTFGFCWGFLNLGDLQSAKDCARQINEAYPEKFLSQSIWMPINWYQREWDAAIKVVASLAERTPGWRDYDRIMAKLIAGRGNIKRARSLMAEAYPDLLEEELQLSATVSGELNAALVFAAILNASGETRQRDILLVALETRMTSMHRIRGESYGVLDMYIHALRGDRDKAIAALREAIDMGWKESRGEIWLTWWALPDDWMLGSLRRDPEFIALMEELEADIAIQRQWYEENKDMPLVLSTP